MKVVPMMGITYNRYTTEPPEKMTHKVYYTGILKHLIIEVFFKVMLKNVVNLCHKSLDNLTRLSIFKP
jgi:hypothetical protein